MIYDITISNKKIENNNDDMVLFSHNIDIVSFNNYIQKKIFRNTKLQFTLKNLYSHEYLKNLCIQVLLFNKNIKSIEVYEKTLKVYLFFYSKQISLKDVLAYIINLGYYIPALFKNDKIKLNFIFSIFSNNSNNSLIKTSSGRACGISNGSLLGMIVEYIYDIFRLVINGINYTAKGLSYIFYLIIIMLEKIFNGIINVFIFISGFFKFLLQSILFIMKFTCNIVMD